jgi:poly [ADP-ribose] polymerase 2/3/4
MKRVKLLFVSADNNHNKFYDMEQTSDDRFLVTYGRVGSKGSQKEYPMRDWDKLYKSKTRKGYQDVTANHKVYKGKESGMDLSTLKPKVRSLIETLNKHAKEAFKLNYESEISDISEHMVEKAQEYINEINEYSEVGADRTKINQLLMLLYRTIPRKMKKVKDSLIQGDDKLTSEMLDKLNDKMSVEQGLLDVVKGQLDKLKAESDDTDTDDVIDNSKVLTVLDKLGLDIDEVSASDEQMLKNLMNESKHRFVQAYEVTNYKTQKAFDKEIGSASNNKTQLLFHGSRAENWLNIIRGGLVLHPNAVTTGKLYDNGIYFADVADKALGYIDGGRWNNDGGKQDNWLAVYEVHLGKQATSDDLPNTYVKLHDWIPDNGYDSYFARKGKDKRYNLYRNEFIIYKESKCTIKYLIQIN